MSNATETIIFLRRARETAPEKEKETRTGSSWIKALVGRLRGSLTARDAEEQKPRAGRSLEQVLALYAPNEQPHTENRNLPALYRPEELRNSLLPYPNVAAS